MAVGFICFLVISPQNVWLILFPSVVNWFIKTFIQEKPSRFTYSVTPQSSWISAEQLSLKLPPRSVSVQLPSWLLFLVGKKSATRTIHTFCSSLSSSPSNTATFANSKWKQVLLPILSLVSCSHLSVCRKCHHSTDTKMPWWPNTTRRESKIQIKGLISMISAPLQQIPSPSRHHTRFPLTSPNSHPPHSTWAPSPRFVHPPYHMFLPNS